MAYQYRHATESDLEAIANVYNESRRGQPAHRGKTPEELRVEIFEAEGFDPDGSWIVLEDGNPIGYGDAIVERTGTSGVKNIGFVGADVVPSHRGKGVEQELVARALSFIESAGVNRARAWSFEGDEWRRSLLEHLGFASDRRFFSMVCIGGIPGDAFIPPDGVVFRHELLGEAKDGDLSILVNLSDESFKEHYGYVKTTERQFKSLGGSTEDVFRLTFATEGGSVAGFSLVEDSIVFNREHGTKDGWILMVGVLKGHRRRGIGSALIADGVRWLDERGVTTVRLGVDAENRKALELYTTLGFEVAWENYVYEKRLESAETRV